jgi:hypothetical protein
MAKESARLTVFGAVVKRGVAAALSAAQAKV